MKKLKKILKHLFCITFFLLIIICGFLYYALNTESGYKNTIALVNKFSPIQITYQNLEGKFLGKQQIKNLNIKMDNKDLLTAENIELNFNFAELWSNKKISLDNLSIKNTVLNLPESADKKEETKKSKPLKQLPQINLPLVLEIKKIAVENFVIPELNFTINNFYSDAKLEHSLANLNANIDLVIGENKINGDLKAKADLRNDYPLELLANSKINIKKDNLDIGLALLGSALKPELKIISQGLVNGEITSVGDISLEKQYLKLASELKNLKYQNYLLNNLALNLEGKFTELYLNLVSQFGDGKIIPKSNLESSLLITPNSLKGISLNLKTLGGELKAFANLNFSPLSWEGELKIFNVLGKNYPQIKELKDLKLNGEVLSSGKIENNNLKINTEIKNLVAKYQNLDLKANGKLNLDNTKIIADNFNLNLANNQIQINGILDNNSALTLDINAPNLSKLSKVLGINIKGEVLGKLTAAGDYLNPKIKGNLNWKNFNFNELISSQKGSLNLDGDLENLKSELKTSLKGKGIPALNANISANVAPLKGVENLKAELGILEGKVNLDGKASWNSGISWDIKLKTNAINPNFYAKDLKGKINAVLNSVGKINGGKIQIDNELKELSGSFMGHKLGGAGKVNILDKKIDIPSLSLAVGDNRIAANGTLTNDSLNFKAKLNMPSLSSLYPKLYGNVSGDLAVNGKIKNPELKADLNVGAFKFMGNEIRSGKIKINTGLTANSSFSNRIELNGISAAGMKWNSIILNTDGSIQSHRLNLKTQGGQYDINELSLSGGVSKNLDAWRGSINALAVDIEGIKLRTRTTAQLEASAKAQSLRNFCITDATNSSDICLNVSHSDKTNLDFNIAKLTPKSFNKYIPKTIRLNNQISGRGNVVISANKSLSGSANLTISAGKIVINTGSSAPIVLNLQRGGLAANLNGSTVNAKALIDLGKSGNLNAEVNLGNLFTKPTINGKAIFNVADIGAYKYLAPQLSVLQGQLKGQVAIAGALNKPSIGGDILLSNGRVVVPQFSTDLNNIRLAVQSGKDGNFHIDGNIGTPEGALKANGVLKITPLTLNLKLSGKRMLVANSKQIKVYISPDFDITITPKDGLTVGGQILIPEARIAIPDIKGSVSASEDVVIKSKKKKYASKKKSVPDNATETNDNMPTKMRIAIVLGDKVFFKNSDMNIRLLGKLTIWLRNGNLRGTGRVEVAEGTYEVYGQELIIQRGSATFSGDIANPSLDILALREIGDIKAGAKVSGTVRNMKLELTSEPLMPDASILSYLLTGKAPDSATDSTALLQTAVAMGTRAIIPTDLADATGLDVLDINISGIKAGKYLGENLYVGMKSDFFNSITTFLARYKINKRLSVEGSSSTKDGSAIDLLYEWEK